MMMIMVLSTMTSLFLTLPLANTPLSLLLLIIMISLSVSIMFSMQMSSWYAFLIFLIYLGGMLVMFTYFAATTPNQASTSSNLSAASFIFIFIPVTSLFLTSTNLPTMSLNNLQLASMYTSQNSYTLIFITLILLLTMLIVVKLTKTTSGPMRTFMYVPAITKNPSTN